MGPDELGRALERLEARLTGLEERIVALEAAPLSRATPGSAATTGAGASRRTDGPPDSDTDTAPPPWSLYLTLLGTLCFALVGALVLRVAAQQGWLDAAVGTAFGFVYSAALLVVPAVLVRRGLATRTGPLLQFCGALLAPLVVLEMYHRQGVMDAALATALLAAVGLAAAALGALAERRLLAAIGLLIPIAGVVAIGLDPAAAGLRAAVPLLCVGAAFFTAVWRGWSSLRPLVVSAAAFVLTAGVALTAHRASIAPAVGDQLVFSVGILWGLVAVDAALRRRTLTGVGAAGLALATLWAFGIARLGRPEEVAPMGAPLAAVLLVAGGALAWRFTDLRRYALGLLASGALIAVVTFPAVDPSGLLLGFAALLVVGVARKLGRRMAGALSLIPALAAIFTIISVGGLFQIPAEAPLPRALSGTLLAALLFLFAWCMGGRGLQGRGVPLWRWLSAIPLVGGAVVCFGALRVAAYVVLGDGPAFQLGETVLLAGVVLASLALAWLWSVTALRVLGLVGAASLAAKVLLGDLLSLEGGLLLGAVACLGLASVGASLLLRLPARDRKTAEDGGRPSD